MITTEMARGVLVLDENLLSLRAELHKRNFRIMLPEPGESDDRIIMRLCRVVFSSPVTQSPSQTNVWLRYCTALSHQRSCCVHDAFLRVW